MPALANSAQLLAFPRPNVGLRARLMAAFKQHRLPEHLSEALIHEACALPTDSAPHALAETLEMRMQPAPLELQDGARFFLIGPSGAGVSNVAEKIRRRAHNSAMNILVESQSFHPRNMRARTAFSCISLRPEVEVIGVVSALTDAEDIGEIISAFHLDRIIVTGLDMARRFGALTAAATQGARLAHVTRSPANDAPLETLSADELADMLLSPAHPAAKAFAP